MGDNIKQIVERINDENGTDGGLWLPKIQRYFVWSEDQICRLFDSILRGYPISSMLFWYNDLEMSYRGFVKDWTDDFKVKDLYPPRVSKDKKKTIVLDGQQRLQSFYIGLKGSFEGKFLYVNLLSGIEKTSNGMLYEFKFLPSDDSKFPFVLFRDIVYQKYHISPSDITEKYLTLAKKQSYKLTKKEKKIVERNVNIIRNSMNAEISYTKLDSISDIERYSMDDVVEIFIRANSGGTTLSKSDLLFSLLISDWEDADIKMADLLDKINKYDYEFDRDFILKTCLALFDKGAEYDISKFRGKKGDELRKKIENNWKKISNSIKVVVDFVHGKTYAKTHKALTSYLALIPLIYFHYKRTNEWDKLKNKDEYIIRTLLAGTFGGHSDGVINNFIEQFKNMKKLDALSVFDKIRKMNYNVDISSERIFSQMGYGSRYVHLVMNVLYKDINYIPALENNLPQIDHIFPRSAMQKETYIHPDTKRPRRKYSTDDINQLANCMMLTLQENGAGGKGDTLPEDWFKDKTDAYLELHCIPKDPNLWKIKNFDKFIKNRKKLLEKKLANYLIVKA